MKNTVDLAPVLSFLKQLEKNNNRPWFEEHRADYETSLARFEDFVAALIAEISAFEELGAITPKDCMFRIYRDVRFSKDKSPYKTYMAASIGAGGRKSRGYPYYVHIGPGDNSMLAGGCHEASSGHLTSWRNAVVKDAPTIRKIIDRKEFVSAFGGISGEKLARPPRGYPADHPEIELLRLKQITVMHALTDKEVGSPSVAQKSAAVFKTMKPFLDYLGSIMPISA